VAVHTKLLHLKPPTGSPCASSSTRYAHCADRRDSEGQKALSTDDTRFAVYMDGEDSEPTYVLQGREALTPVFDDLNRYEATTHFKRPKHGHDRREPRHRRELHDRPPPLSPKTATARS